ncbi:CocE/NonD family hydrolase [Limimaricola litoreus]|uniref:CocE/NonD family hydrolase n=1 Tax=Limimaricola litoreus TaxID=2955316 RepID=A0A9X2JSA0_9RHOB|nr:CocE/NonD family hydrolase [Limimaricola litoreus]MCP1169516.1 CocE/NonD family hydrolase [Limimaricola litoreus]
MTSNDTLHDIRDDRHFRIPLPDGTILSARLWCPVDADETPVPAILEYLPYRKSDGTAERDAGMHPWFAQRGYACLRVDRRGCGESEGLFDDEYSEQELQDGEDIIAWIAAQDWCTGAVGMQGISWGGFNSLQLAARAPEALKAVVTIGSTTDRYADDVHYKGGLQHTDNTGWAATVLSWFSTPPDPALVGDDWRDIWLRRLEETPPLARIWAEHNTRDAYWKHGSVCEDYGSIKAAVLALGGLHDGYRNTMRYLVENLSAPVKGIVGPWGHKYPHVSNIGPSIGYLQEALRWWDRWLKGIGTGVENDPAWRAYVMDSARPDPSADHRDGRWIAEPTLPEPNVSRERLVLGAGLAGDLPRVQPADLRHGEQCGEFFTFGFGAGELPGDQMPDDARAACFDADARDTDVDILGRPRVRLRLSADRPRAQLVVRLCDLRPDGTSMLITMGLLDLRNRDGFETKADLTPGETVEVILDLDETAYRLPAGHRLRLAVAGSYWPYVWPEPECATLTVVAGDLDLPLRTRLAQENEFDFPLPVSAPARKTRELRKAWSRKHHEIDFDTGRTTLVISADHGRIEDLETGLVTGSAVTETYSIDPGNPAKVDVLIEWDREFGRGDWFVSTRARTRVSGCSDSYDITQRLVAKEGETEVFARDWKYCVAR